MQGTGFCLPQDRAGLRNQDQRRRPEEPRSRYGCLRLDSHVSFPSEHRASTSFVTSHRHPFDCLSIIQPAWTPLLIACPTQRCPTPYFGGDPVRVLPSPLSPTHSISGNFRPRLGIAFADYRADYGGSCLSNLKLRWDLNFDPPWFSCSSPSSSSASPFR